MNRVDKLQITASLPNSFPSRGRGEAGRGYLLFMLYHASVFIQAAHADVKPLLGT